MDTNKFEQIRREQFPMAKQYTYLDTATTGLYSIRSKKAMIDFIESRYANAMSIEDFEENWKYAERLRETVAKVLNANSDEIFFSGSGSDMLNIFSNGIDLNQNANVIVTDLSFPSTPYNWFNRIGEKNVRIAKSKDGQLSSEELFKLVDKDTAVIALCIVENTSGFYHDIKKIGDFCKEHGIYFVLDATQCIGALNIDVKNTHIDFLVATTYKWLSGAFGISFAYVSNRILYKIQPTYVGWTGNKERHNHSRYKLDLDNGANRFETGSLNWIGLKGIDQSMQIYLELGKDDVQEYILHLTDYLYEKVGGLRDVNLIGPFPKINRSGITYLTFPKEWTLNDRIMSENGIRAHVASDTTIRVALHLYNNKADIDMLVSFLESKQK